MQKSVIQTDTPNVNIKNKTRLKKRVEGILPTWRNVRILTDETDLRSQGHKVAVCEQNQQGKLTVLVGAPDLTTAFGFVQNAVADGRIK